MSKSQKQSLSLWMKREGYTSLSDIINDCAIFDAMEVMGIIPGGEEGEYTHEQTEKAVSEIGTMFP